VNMKTMSKRWTVVALSAALLGGATLAGAAEEGSLPGLAGGSLSAADLESGAVIIVVWASWSPRCREIVAQVNAIQQRWGREARVVTVAFQEDAAKVRAFLGGQSKLEAPVFLDEDASFSKKHSVTHLPSLLVFNRGAKGFSGKLPTDPDPVIGKALG